MFRAALGSPDEVAACFGAKVHDEQRRSGLLKDGIEPVRLRHVPHLGHGAQECFHAPNQIGVLRV